MSEPAHGEARWLTAPEQHAWRTYIDTSYQLLDLLNRDLAANCDLTLADYRILVLLSEGPKHRRRMSELADGVMSSRSRLTHQIARLVQRGLVERDECVEDGRGVFAVLTNDGFAALAKAAPHHVDTVRRVFVDRLEPGQLEQLAATLEQVRQAIELES